MASFEVAPIFTKLLAGEVIENQMVQSKLAQKTWLVTHDSLLRDQQIRVWLRFKDFAVLAPSS
jgi:hypothetical protein